MKLHSSDCATQLFVHKSYQQGLRLAWKRQHLFIALNFTYVPVHCELLLSIREFSEFFTSVAEKAVRNVTTPWNWSFSLLFQLDKEHSVHQTSDSSGDSRVISLLLCVGWWFYTGGLNWRANEQDQKCSINLWSFCWHHEVGWLLTSCSVNVRSYTFLKEDLMSRKCSRKSAAMTAVPMLFLISCSIVCGPFSLRMQPWNKECCKWMSCTVLHP